MKALFVIFLLLCGTPAWATNCGNGHPIVLAGLNWESGEFITAVVQEILERGFGCKTETIPGNTITFEQALANDDVQIIAEEWIDRSEIWKKAAAEGRVIAIGNPFTETAEGWAVPEYVVKGDAVRGIKPMAPDLRSVSQLADKKYIELFKDPEQPTHGRFLNCPSGWTCEPENTAKLHAYGLDDLYVDFRPGTGPAMDAAITSAYLQGRPVLFYYWSPSAIAGAINLVPLSEPPYTAQCWHDMMGGVAAVHEGCASPPSIVAYGFSKNFAATAPEIVGVLSKVTFKLKELNANLATMAHLKRSARVQADAFLKERAALWKPWVDAATAERIELSLQEGGAKGASSPATTEASFPSRLVISMRQPVNDALAALVSQHGAAFRALSHALLAFIVMLDNLIALIPWWLLIGILMGLAWIGTHRPILTLTIGVLMFVVGMLGLWSLMLQTLTLMLISSLVAVVIGLPVGVLSAKFRWFRTLVFPVLDVMQTMPSFVYLIPALMLFGLGKVHALIATVI